MQQEKAIQVTLNLLCHIISQWRLDHIIFCLFTKSWRMIVEDPGRIFSFPNYPLPAKLPPLHIYIIYICGEGVREKLASPPRSFLLIAHYYILKIFTLSFFFDKRRWVGFAEGRVVLFLYHLPLPSSLCEISSLLPPLFFLPARGKGDFLSPFPGLRHEVTSGALLLVFFPPSQFGLWGEGRRKWEKRVREATHTHNPNCELGLPFA